jgi:choline-sulfatase
MVNILIIMCDSARADAYENTPNGSFNWVKTPVADQLSRDGLTFSRAFTPIGLCHPARASIDSGLHGHANGQLVNTAWDKFNLTGLLPTAPSYLRQLQAAGYRVGYTGQRHLRQSAFDDVVHGAITAFKIAGLKEEILPDRPKHPPFYGELTLPPEQHRDGFTMRGACELLRRYAVQDKPWLIQIEYDGPHPPFYMPQQYANLYPHQEILPPINFTEGPASKPVGHARARAQQMPEPWNENWQRLVAHYGGYITMLDSFTGEILTELDRLGMAEETIVIFTSDHGEMVGAHGVVTKYAQMYDDVLRIPLRVRWPGHITPGTVESSFVSHVDLLPTLVELASAPPPSQTHGKSWASLTRGEELSAPRDAHYGQLHAWGSSWHSLRTARTEGWKYVYGAFVEDELYDLKADPGETNNLAATMPEQVKNMRARLADEMRAIDDPLARTADFK